MFTTFKKKKKTIPYLYPNQWFLTGGSQNSCDPWTHLKWPAFPENFLDCDYEFFNFKSQNIFNDKNFIFDFIMYILTIY